VRSTLGSGAPEVREAKTGSRTTFLPLCTPSSYDPLVKLRGLVLRLAFAGSLSGAWACGGRTGVGLFDDVGIDGGGQDARLDSSGDVTADAPSRHETGAAIEPDATSSSSAACVVQVAAGGTFTCVRKSDGTLWCWGGNSNGELGDGTTTDHYDPVQTLFKSLTVEEVAAGPDHACAVLSDGSVWCWGGNSDGELGDGTTTAASSPVPVTGLDHGVTDVATSQFHTCAVKGDGSVWCWGGDYVGQLGNGTTNSSTVPIEVTSLPIRAVQVTAGYYETCVVGDDGSVWCWGGTPAQVTGFPTTAAEVASGDQYACARLTDTSLWCWGSNYTGTLGDGTMTSSQSPVRVIGLDAGVIAVATAFSTCAITEHHALWCWGDDEWGQIGDGTATDGYYGGPLQPREVIGLDGGVAAMSVLGHVCALKTDGSLWCWGDNVSGELGNGTTIDSYVPIQVMGPCP